MALVLFSVFMFIQYHDAKNKIATSAPAAANKQVEDVVTKVGKLIILPKDEKPDSVQTVSDIAKLKGLDFFTNAQKGDKLIVYTKSKKAILYRPSTNQLVNVAPVTVTPSGSTTISPQ